MTLDEALTRLRASRSKLERLGVTRAAVFGSVARGEAGPDSDIDVFVEIDPSRPVGLWGLSSIFHAVEEALPGKVDAVELPSLKPHVRVEALRDGVYAF